MSDRDVRWKDCEVSLLLIKFSETSKRIWFKMSCQSCITLKLYKITVCASVDLRTAHCMLRLDWKICKHYKKFVPSPPPPKKKLDLIHIYFSLSELLLRSPLNFQKMSEIALKWLSFSQHPNMSFY